MITEKMRDAGIAEMRAVQFVASQQSDGKLPSWLAPSMSNLKHETRPGAWIVKIDIFTRRKLAADEHWVDHGPGRRKLVGRIDPKTGQEMIVILGDCGQKRYPLFEVEVDLRTGACVLLKNTDLASLRPSDFEIEPWPSHIPKPGYVSTD